MEGNELAAARVVDTNTLPSKGAPKLQRVVSSAGMTTNVIQDSGLDKGAGLCGSSTKPSASIVPNPSNPNQLAMDIHKGQTREHGLLVTAGGTRLRRHRADDACCHACMPYCCCHAL